MLLSSLPTIRSLYFNFKRFPSINTSTFAAFKSTISLKSPTSKPVPLNKSNDFRSSLYIQRTARYPPVTMPSPIDIHLSAFKSTLPTLEAQLDQLILSARARCQSLSFDKSSLLSDIPNFIQARDDHETVLRELEPATSLEKKPEKKPASSKKQTASPKSELPPEARKRLRELERHRAELESSIMRRALELPAPLDDLSLYVHQLGERRRSGAGDSPHDVSVERLQPNGDLRIELELQSCSVQSSEAAEELSEVRAILASLTADTVRASRLAVPSARREPNAGLSFLVGPLAQLEWALQQSASAFFARHAPDALAVAVPHLQRAPVLEACGSRLAPLQSQSQTRTQSDTHTIAAAGGESGGEELLVEQNTLPDDALRDPFIPRQLFLAGVRLSAFAALFMRQEMDALALPMRLYAVGRQYSGPPTRPAQDVVLALFALCSNALQAARLHAELLALARLYVHSVLPTSLHSNVSVVRRAPTQLRPHEAGRSSVLVQRPQRADAELAFVSTSADFVARRLCTRLFTDAPPSASQPVQLCYPHMVYAELASVKRLLYIVS